MARSFESYTSPVATGATKEDLDPKLNLLAQMETPIYSSIGRGTTTNTEPSLIERDLAAAAPNAQPENVQFITGATGNLEAPDGGTRRTFRTQIFTKFYSVTGTEQATASVTYEGKKRLAELRAIYGLELKRDMEYAICRNGAGNAGTADDQDATIGDGTARQLAGYFSLISAGTTTGSVGTVAEGTAFENAINANMQALYASGGVYYKMGNSFVKDANMLVVSPRTKVEFDQRLDEKNSTYRQTNSGGMLGVEVTKYGSSFGPLMVVPDIHMPEGSASVYNPMNWKWITLRPTHEQEFAKTGDGENRGLVHEGTLMHRHRAASGALTGITYTTS